MKPVDYQRETCEIMMNAIRKIRLYIRDPKATGEWPPLLLRNTIGLITASEKQFDHISSHYDFYRMIQEDLFVDSEANPSNSKIDRTFRNSSIASDLIGARHDYSVAEKHFRLADEFSKKGSLTAKQVMNILNQYGHCCSHKSYLKMKTKQQHKKNNMVDNFNEQTFVHEEPLNSEFDLLDL